MKIDADFYKSRYDYELDRKDKLTAALPLPVGLLTILGSAMVAMARSFSYTDSELAAVFLVFVVLAVCALFGCAWRLWRAYDAQTYEYLPLLQDLEEARGEWMLFFEEARAGGDEGSKAYEDELDKHIIKAADENTRNNDGRSAWLHQSRRWLFAVFCFTALAGIPYVADQVRF
jgi:hypothetical protein